MREKITENRKFRLKREKKKGERKRGRGGGAGKYSFLEHDSF